jgi:hypothetical protein
MTSKPRITKTFLRFPLTAVILLTLSTISIAELPPSVYQEWQAKAPDFLMIKVRSIKTAETDEPRLVRVAVSLEAQIEQVRRSQSSLKAGDVITIKYEHRKYKEPMVGPSEVPILKEGQSYPAYLKKGPEGFEPAAGGYSFREMK